MGDEELRAKLSGLEMALRDAAATLVTLGAGLTKLAQELAALVDAIGDGSPPADAVDFVLGPNSPTSLKVTWDTDRADVKLWEVGRDGADSMGSGPWSTTLAADLREMTFSALLPNTPYTLTLTPIFFDNTRGTSLTLTGRTSAGPSTPGPNPGTPTGVAQRLNWGQRHAISDDFSVDGRPDPGKWRYCGKYGEGWEGHSKNGRRMPENSFVKDGLLVLRGDANGDTGWLRQNLPVKQGRWEICCRSRNTGSSGGLYHPLFLIWPTSERWPQDGELDLLEYEDPNAKAAKAYLHYPHNPGPVQQIPFKKDGVDMTQWHVFSFEWTRSHVRSWIDGEEWYSASGGKNSTRRDIQDMPEGRATIQLDNFTGDGGLRPAVFEFQYVNFYAVP